MILDPELQAAAAPLETPAVAPTPAVPTVAAPFQTNPVAPSGPVASLGAVAPAAPNPGPSPRTALAQALVPALQKNPLQYLGKVAVAGHIAAGLDLLLGGATNALSRVAAPEGSGMAVLSQTAQNIEAAKQAKIDAAQKAQQQQFENNLKTNEDKRAQTELGLEQQKNTLLMAQGHAALITSNRIASQETDEFNQKMQAGANTLAKPMLDAGGEVVSHDLPDSKLADFMSKNTNNGDHYAHFQDGRAPVIDPNTGKQKIDLDGNPVTEPTYSVIKLGPNVTLNQPQVDFLNKFDPEAAQGGQWQAGQTLSGQAYYSVAMKAQQQQTVALNVEKAQSEIKRTMSEAQKNKAEAALANQSAAVKAQNLRTSQMFATYLAQTGGDPVLALDLMKRSKDANSIGAVEQMYGPGTLAKLRAQNLTTLTETIESDQKQLNDPVASATMPADEKANTQDELRAAKMARNAYLGLHVGDPDQITKSVLQLDEVDPAKRGATILGSTTMPNNAKIYLLRHYNLPVPPALLSKPAAQPAPAPTAQ